MIAKSQSKYVVESFRVFGPASFSLRMSIQDLRGQLITPFRLDLKGGSEASNLLPSRMLGCECCEFSAYSESVDRETLAAVCV